MFVEADVVTRLVEGETRHFIEAREAVFDKPTNKKARLTRRKNEQVLNAGGMLLSSEKQIAALRETGLAIVVVNSDKSDQIAALEPLIAQAKAGAESITSTENYSHAPSQGDRSSSATIWLEDTARLAEMAPDVEEEASKPKRPKSAAAPSSERCKNFGPNDTGWMKVATTGEGDRAFMQVLSFGGDDSLGEEDVFKALEDLYGIKASLDEDTIKRVAAQAASSPNRVIRGQFLVADAAPGAGDEIGHIDYTFLEGIIGGVELTYVELREAMERAQLSQVLDQNLLTRLVAPGEELAVFMPSDKSWTGLDIFGTPRLQASAEALLEAGRYVQLEGGRYLSKIYGYVCLLDGEISVLPPIWLSSDLMEAHLVYLPQATPGPILIRDWLVHLLEIKGIRHGIDAVAIETLLDDPPGGTEPDAFCVARGSAPGRGEDVRVEFAFELGHEMEQDFGVLDWRGGLEVSKGQLLVKILPATKGRPGTNVAVNPCQVFPAVGRGSWAGRTCAPS